MSLDRFKLKITLRQITPVVVALHETEHLLRSTEMKPKLNKFLVHKIKNGAEVFPKAHYSWLIGKGENKDEEEQLLEHLDFRITGFEYFHADSDELVNEKQGVTNDRFMATKVFYWTPKPNSSSAKTDPNGYRLIDLTIKSKHVDLLAKIKSWIDEFFIVSNFGRGQSKGFGQFVTTNEVSQDFIEETLLQHFKINNTDNFKIYRIPVDELGHYGKNQSYPDKLIDKIYKKIKSGINHREYHKSLLFQYFCQSAAHNKSDFIGWEKKAMKVWMINKGGAFFKERVKHNRSHEYKDLPLMVGCDHIEETKEAPKQFENFYFIRALLGLPEHYEFAMENEIYYVNEEKSNGYLQWSNAVFENGTTFKYDKTKIKVSSEEIEQFPSTIQFKVVGEQAYLIPLSTAAIQDKEFTFTGQVTFQKNRNVKVIPKEVTTKIDAESFSLRTPKEFNLVDFFDFELTSMKENNKDKTWDKELIPIYERLGLTPVETTKI